MKLFLILLTLLYTSIALSQTVRTKDDAIANKVLGKGNVIVAQAQRTNTVTLSVSNPSPSPQNNQIAYGYAYSDAIGNWYMWFFYSASYVGRTGAASIDIDGVTFKVTSSGIWHPCSGPYEGSGLDTGKYAAAQEDGSSLFWDFSASHDAASVICHVALESKPTWADANLIGR